MRHTARVIRWRGGMACLVRLDHGERIEWVPGRVLRAPCEWREGRAVTVDCADGWRRYVDPKRLRPVLSVVIT
jgi:hypothetical protein